MFRFAADVYVIYRTISNHVFAKCESFYTKIRKIKVYENFENSKSTRNFKTRKYNQIKRISTILFLQYQFYLLF